MSASPSVDDVTGAFHDVFVHVSRRRPVIVEPDIPAGFISGEAMWLIAVNDKELAFMRNGVDVRETDAE